MADTNAGSEAQEGTLPTVAIEGPAARALAESAAVIGDLQFVMECCKRLLTELARPEEDRDGVVPQALWSSALVAYARCFGKGRRFGLSAEDVQNLPVHGAVMKFHKWVIEERNKLTARPADPFEVAKIGAALSSSAQAERRVEGIAIFSSGHVLVDVVGVRQLGGLASELAKHIAGKAQEQQDVVLADAQQLNVDSLYRSPPLRMRPPSDGSAEDTS